MQRIAPGLAGTLRGSCAVGLALVAGSLSGQESLTASALGAARPDVYAVRAARFLTGGPSRGAGMDQGSRRSGVAIAR